VSHGPGSNLVARISSTATTLTTQSAHRLFT